MIPKEFKCLSCGATTGVVEAPAVETVLVTRMLLEGLRNFMNRRFDADRLVSYQTHFLRELDAVLVASASAPESPTKEKP